ncbi:hypothetical protein AAC387_Pa03g1339 [Persea americana]
MPAQWCPDAGGAKITPFLIRFAILSLLSLCSPIFAHDFCNHLRYWDTRQSHPVHIQQLLDSCYALIVQHPLMVVGTADRNLIIFNLQNPQTEFKRITSPFKYQTGCVPGFPDHQGFLVCGPVKYRWMYPFERKMKTYK